MRGNGGKLLAGALLAGFVIAGAALADTTLGWYVAGDIGQHKTSTQTFDINDITLDSSSSYSEGSSSSSNTSQTAPKQFNTNSALIIDEEDLANSDFRLKSDNGTAGFLRTGYRFTPKWRAELELGDRQGDISDPLDGASSTFDGSLSKQSLMVNVLYDILPDARLHPFVGVGAGAMKVKAGYSGTTSLPNETITYALHADSTVSAYQLLAGATWSVNDRLSVDLTYRYLRSGKIKYAAEVVDTYLINNNEFEDRLKLSRAKAGSTIADTLVRDTYNANLRSDFDDQSLTIGLRWAFGAATRPKPDLVPMTPPPPPAPVAEIAPVAPPAQPEPPVMALPEPRSFAVYFPFDSSRLTDTASAVISEAASYAKGAPAPKVAVIGHTDTSGSSAYNIALSQRRAKAVADALGTEGIPVETIALGWKGEADPAVPTRDGVPNQENRRATIEVAF